MAHEKILGTITSALGHLEDSVDALTKGDEPTVENNVWHAAADLEYALFLFSLKDKDATRRSSWKLDAHAKQDEIEPLLMRTKDLLKTSKQGIKEGNFLEAHKNAWMARGYLLKVHDAFEKKRKSSR